MTDIPELTFFVMRVVPPRRRLPRKRKKQLKKLLQYTVDIQMGPSYDTWDTELELANLLKYYMDEGEN